MAHAVKGKHFQNGIFIPAMVTLRLKACCAAIVQLSISRLARHAHSFSFLWHHCADVAR